MNADVSLFMLLGGVLVTYIEFVAPGLVVPGVAGSVLAVWGLARLATAGLSPEGLALFLAGAALLVVQSWLRARRYWSWGIVGGAGTLLMGWGAMHLVKPPARIDAPAAWAAVTLFGLITIPLLTAAFQGRHNKTFVTR